MLGRLLDFLTKPWFSIFWNFKIKEPFGSGLIGGERDLEWKNLQFQLFQKLKEPSVFMKQKLANNHGYLGGSFIILLFNGSFISEPVHCFTSGSKNSKRKCKCFLSYQNLDRALTHIFHIAKHPARLETNKFVIMDQTSNSWLWNEFPHMGLQISQRDETLICK